MAYFSSTNQSGSQSHSTNHMAHTYSNFADLLKPVSNLAKVWEIDLTPYINDFFASFLPEDIPDFRTAATLILGAADIFGKKVDFLYEQLQQVLYNSGKQKRRRTAGYYGNFALDLDVYTTDFDISDFCETLPALKSENLFLKPKLPYTTLTYRKISENDDYRISPVFNSILIKNTIVFEQWDAAYLRSALTGHGVEAQPIIFSTPIQNRRIEEMEHTVEQLRTYHIELINADTLQAIPHNSDSQGDNLYERSEIQQGYIAELRNLQRTPEVAFINENALDAGALSCDALEQLQYQDAEEQFDLSKEIEKFSRELADFTASLEKPPKCKFYPRKYVQFKQDRPLTNAIKRIRPCFCIYAESEQDLSPEYLDFDFFSDMTLECHIPAADFYVEKTHSACCKKVVAMRLLLDSALDQEANYYDKLGNAPDQINQLDLNFDVYANVFAPRTGTGPTAVGNVQHVETFKSQLAGRNRQYRRLETEQFLRWASFKAEDRKCDISQIYASIREKIEAQSKEIREIGGYGHNLARAFIGSLLMATNGEVSIKVAENGYIMVALAE